MTDKAAAASTSEIVDALPVYSMDELCRSCEVPVEWVAELTEYGVLEPKGRTKAEWTFSSLSIVRVAKAKRLERDLGLNVPGIALVLDLLGQIDKLRARLGAMQSSDEDAPNAS